MATRQSSKDRRRGPLTRKVLVEVVFSPTSDSAYGSRAMEVRHVMTLPNSRKFLTELDTLPVGIQDNGDLI